MQQCNVVTTTSFLRREEEYDANNVYLFLYLRARCYRSDNVINTRYANGEERDPESITIIRIRVIRTRVRKRFGSRKIIGRLFIRRFDPSFETVATRNVMPPVFRFEIEKIPLSRNTDGRSYDCDIIYIHVHV